MCFCHFKLLCWREHGCEAIILSSYTVCCKWCLIGGSVFGPLGIFKKCHSVVPPGPYFGNCVYDMCATDGQVGALCQAIESYADMCASKGVSIPWRNNTFCRKFVFVLTVVQCQNYHCLIIQATINNFQILSKSLFSLYKVSFKDI